MLDLALLSQQCAPNVHPSTLQRLVHVESSANPYAIGVVGGHLNRQPRTQEEGTQTIRWLENHGYNFSVGIAQVNIKNFAPMQLTPARALNACHNLTAGAAILQSCYLRARSKTIDDQAALRMAFSCYESGNFTRGFQDGYVAKIINAASIVKPDHQPPIQRVRTTQNPAFTPQLANPHRQMSQQDFGDSSTNQAFLF